MPSKADGAIGAVALAASAGGLEALAEVRPGLALDLAAPVRPFPCRITGPPRLDSNGEARRGIVLLIVEEPS